MEFNPLQQPVVSSSTPLRKLAAGTVATTPKAKEEEGASGGGIGTVYSVLHNIGLATVSTIRTYLYSLNVLDSPNYKE